MQVEESDEITLTYWGEGLEDMMEIFRDKVDIWILELADLVEALAYYL